MDEAVGIFDWKTAAQKSWLVEIKGSNVLPKMFPGTFYPKGEQGSVCISGLTAKWKEAKKFLLKSGVELKGDAP
jgi:hypothetical protein